MIHHPSRKEFFAKLLGVTAVFSVFPKLFAKTIQSADATEGATVSTPRLLVRPDARAVARRADSV